MTLSQLKAEADKLGYKVVKKNTRYEYLLPCTCGGKRRGRSYETVWSDSDHKAKPRIIMYCLTCGRDVIGLTEADARRKWNKLIKELKDDTTTS